MYCPEFEKESSLGLMPGQNIGLETIQIIKLGNELSSFENETVFRLWWDSGESKIYYCLDAKLAAGKKGKKSSVFYNRSSSMSEIKDKGNWQYFAGSTYIYNAPCGLNFRYCFSL